MVDIYGYVLRDISELHISRSCSGMGTGGMVTTELRFSAYGAKHGGNAMKAPKVMVSVTNAKGGSLTLPDFWLDTHTVHNNRIDFVCYDRMAFADCIKFTEDDLKSFAVNKVSAYDVVNMIGQKMGVPASGFADATKKIDIESLPGTTCSQWLQSISAVNCGFFYISNENELKFCTFHHPVYEVMLDTELDAYTEPDIGEKVEVDGFIIYGDGGKVYDHSNMGSRYVLEINGGSLVNSKTPDKLEKIIENATYTYGSIDKAIITSIPHVNAVWGSGQLLINNISATISSCGIIASLSANQAGVGEIGAYMGQLSRQLESAIKSGERINKNCMITKYQGTIWLDDDEDEE